MYCLFVEVFVATVNVKSIVFTRDRFARVLVAGSVAPAAFLKTNGVVFTTEPTIFR